MERVSRYLKAVRSYLPREQQDDIIQELADNILSQIEDQQAALGRRLTEDEQETLLRQLGSPLLVASRYRQDARSLALGRRLVGPVLFPLYEKILRLNLGGTAVACVVIALALGRPLLVILPTILVHLFIQFGIVTLVFATAETSLTKSSPS
ncbi:MAG: hypothetical protein JO316_18105 [Abitibacteriaceae bacterium]|nr:hypothetical protein [Abditibacteriaceae bacterium]MBV9867273.1 hypothetical protein [Abditibacteriaceae bacterium]